ncbi:MAG: alpha/beta hydrolase [Bacteroidetes bacterium]|nr:MAG: alpha/beta hydrolase [Bacteroidota bacterium]
MRQLTFPVYLILGRHDWNVPSVQAAAWLDSLQAPAKAVFWMEQAAHGTLEEDPEDFNRILLENIPLE